MRCTLGTAVGLIAATIVGISFWTDVPPVVPPPTPAVAQEPPAETRPAANAEAVKRGSSAVDAKLDGRRQQLDFVEMPLKDVLEFLGDSNEIDILLNKRVLLDLDISEDLPVTLQVKRTAVTARTALDLVLEQVSNSLGYTVRDGLVYVTNKFDNDEIQVYNVRDLLASFPAATPPGPGGAPGGIGGAFPGGLGGEGGMGGGIGAPRPTSASPAGEALLTVIESTVMPDTWSTVGGSGSLAEFNGLLIVKQSQTVHREINQLLEMMREVDKRALPAR